MQTVKDIFELRPPEIDEKILSLKESQREIVSLLARGKSDQEITTLLSINIGALRARIYSACDRAGVRNRAQLIALYSVWEYVP